MNFIRLRVRLDTRFGIEPQYGVHQGQSSGLNDVGNRLIGIEQCFRRFEYESAGIADHAAKHQLPPVGGFLLLASVQLTLFFQLFETFIKVGGNALGRFFNKELKLWVIGRFRA